jgi:hypothetical protein
MGFQVERLHRGDRILAVGALALLVLMFCFKWFALDLSSLGGGVSALVGALLGAKGLSTSVNAWHSLEVIRWVLLLTVISAMALVMLDGIDRKRELALSPSIVVAGLGALSSVLVFWRVFVSHPFAHASVKPAAYLGLAACILIGYGGYLAMAGEDTVMAGEATAMAADENTPLGDVPGMSQRAT